MAHGPEVVGNTSEASIIINLMVLDTGSGVRFPVVLYFFFFFFFYYALPLRYPRSLPLVF